MLCNMQRTAVCWETFALERVGLQLSEDEDVPEWITLFAAAILPKAKLVDKLLASLPGAGSLLLVFDLVLSHT